ncbi:Ubiquitin- modifier 1 [Orbilia ellipsospora]|uniref:Ubiquitin-related modifier 1 n=1 Tax=Orbilia ellipsospora TaxID=2528407 RepID=A0AAV9XIL7_9PEZI
MATDSIAINVELAGGLEILFNNERKLNVELPATTANGSPPNINYLVGHLCDHHMKDSRRELFELQGTVRPGILVLINDADWELEGEGEYELKPKDQILFVSTLHGG